MKYSLYKNIKSAAASLLLLFCLLCQETPLFAAEKQSFTTGKKPYPPGTRDKWIASGRALGRAPAAARGGRKASSIKGAADNSTNLPALGNQGAENACVYWAGALVKDINMKRLDSELDLSALSNQCSPRFTYNLSNGGNDIGAYGHEPFEIFLRYGTASRQQMPYVDGQYTNIPVVADFIEGLHRRSTNYVWLWEWNPDAGQIAELKQLLDEGGAASVALCSDASFTSLSTTSAPWIGAVCNSWNLNHMVTVCGYDTNWYLIANSWGTGWGSNGFARIDADYFESYCGDVFYPLEDSYSPATNYIVIQASHPRRRDLQQLQIELNGSVYRSFSPTPLDMPTGSVGAFVIDNRDDLNIAVDLSLANWLSLSNTVTVRLGDREVNSTGTLQSTTLILGNSSFTSPDTPAPIPDLSGNASAGITVYRLDTEASVHGSVPVQDQWLRAGTSTSITAEADQYYHFTNWSGDASGSANPIPVLMDRPKTVTAIFTENLTPNTATPEAWLASYGYTDFENDALLDPLGKGMQLWEEYIAGTDPSNAADVFEISSMVNSNGILEFSFLTRTGRTYNVYSGTNLSDSNGWNVLPPFSNIIGSNAVVTATNMMQETKFYRVGVQLNN